MEKQAPIVTIDDYIAAYPPATQKILEQMRATIKAAAPDAQESISYQVPSFELGTNLVRFAAAKNHIGFYPTPSAITAFEKELSVYKGAKGSVQFPMDKPLPRTLIRKMVKFRVAENKAKRKAKAAKKK